MSHFQKTSFILLFLLFIGGTLWTVQLFQPSNPGVEGSRKITLFKRDEEAKKTEQKRKHQKERSGERIQRPTESPTKEGNGSKVTHKETLLFDVLTKDLFKGIPSLLRALGYNREEIQEVLKNKVLSEKLGKLQKRAIATDGGFNDQLGSLGCKILIPFITDDEPQKNKALLQDGKILFKDPKDKNHYLELTAFFGHHKTGQRTFIRYDKFPEMNAILKAEIHFLQRFRRQVRKEVNKFLKK
ncbi:MAG TPA: hypothetical protein ENK02_05610 [Planctomycetes bacterium]|nr:hypothetical protein [Planctomycetota bacterium]